MLAGPGWLVHEGGHVRPLDYLKALPGLVWSWEGRRRHGVLQRKSVSLPAVNEALEDSRRTCLLCLMMLSSAGHH